MSKEALITLVTAVLTLVPLSCLGVGCGPKAGDASEFSTIAATHVKTAQDLGLEAQAFIYVKPNGYLTFGPTFNYGNDSYAIVVVKSDPAKAKLLKDATDPR